MKKAQIIIEFNPSTGVKRPYECYWVNEESGRIFNSSSATIEGARKSAKATAKRNASYYTVEIIENL
jgi:hypothetical protein